MHRVEQFNAQFKQDMERKRQDWERQHQEDLARLRSGLATGPMIGGRRLVSSVTANEMMERLGRKRYELLLLEAGRDIPRRIEEEWIDYDAIDFRPGSGDCASPAGSDGDEPR